MGIVKDMKNLKLNVDLKGMIVATTKKLLWEIVDVFAKIIRSSWYSPHIVEHKIELDTMIPPSHQRCYFMNFNYVMVIKQNINNFLATRFVELMEQATWLSPIVVVTKKIANCKFALIFKS
jgi:hypothetical protein